MATIVSSPINRKPTSGLELSPGARATQNYHPKADSEPSTSKATAGDKARPGSIRRGGGARDDGGLSASEHHLLRHRMLGGTVR
jgi:hypothetical protein